MHSALYFVYHLENKDKIVAVNVDVPLFIIQVLPPEYPDMVCETGLPVVGKMVISSPPLQYSNFACNINR